MAAPRRPGRPSGLVARAGSGRSPRRGPPASARPSRCCWSTPAAARASSTLGPQAGRPRRGPRRVRVHRDGRAGPAVLRAPAAAGPAGRPLHHRPQRLARRPRPRLGELPGPDGPVHPRKSSNPPPRPTTTRPTGPCCSACGRTAGFPYTAVHVNGPALVPERRGPGQYGGFLGRGSSRCVLGDVDRGPGACRGLDPRPELPPVRLEARRVAAARRSTGYRAGARATGACGELDGRLPPGLRPAGRAPQCREAFDLARRAGRRARPLRPVPLRARRACWPGGWSRRGCRWVTVFWNHSIRGQDKAPGPDRRLRLGHAQRHLRGA